MAPFILMIIYAIAFFIRNKFIKEDDPTRKYFLKGLHLKLLGAVATAFIYWYYYGDGDTIYYFRRIKYLHELIGRDFATGLKVLFYTGDELNYDLYHHLQRVRYYDQSYFKVVQIGTLASFFALGTYLGIAFIFSFVSYLGIWLLFRVFYHQYPKIYKHLAYSVLYVPSVVFWGSGLFKDTITIGCVGVVTYNVYRVFIKPKRRILNGVLMVVNILLITVIKTYIVACLVPMLLAWVILYYRSNIKSKFIKLSITPILIVATAVGGFVMTQQIASMSDTFSFDQLEKRAVDMVWWHNQVLEIYGEEGGGGSHYSLGNPYDFSLTGILKKVPLAINVTLFRPYLWEAGNPVMLLSAFESLFLLCFFLWLFLKMRFKLIGKMFGEPFLVMSFGFAFLFSVGVGITSYNFGALVRYKIPCMPYFISGLIIVYYKYKNQKEEKKLKKELALESIEK